MNIRFTIEETNLISIFICEDRASLIEEMSDALPYMDEDMRGLADRTLDKLRAMTDEEFAELDVYAAE
jgi:hypothetical protein